jgi:hypothetical protein
MSMKINQNNDSIPDIYSFTFTTVDADTVPPLLTGSYPVNNAVNISRSADFQIDFNEPLDSTSLGQGFELRDQSNVLVPLTAPVSTILGIASRVAIKPVSLLDPGINYSLTVKNNIKDFAGNLLSSSKTITFKTEPVITFNGTVVEAVDAVGGWKAPSYSGSTVNVDATFSIVSSPKVGGTGAGKLTYRFTASAGGVLREYNANKPATEGGNYFGIWIYGDNSKHLLEYWIYNPSATMVFVDTLNWTGWKLKTINLNTLSGTGRTLAGIVIKQNAAGSTSGVIYFDELTVGNTITDMFSAALQPAEYKLEQNYPNPFNGITNYEFRITNEERVTITIFDLLGREVTTVVDEKLNPGQHTIRWNSGDLPSGIYFYKVQSGNFSAIKKMVLLK